MSDDKQLHSGQQMWLGRLLHTHQRRHRFSALYLNSWKIDNKKKMTLYPGVALITGAASGESSVSV